MKDKIIELIPNFEIQAKNLVISNGRECPITYVACSCCIVYNTLGNLSTGCYKEVRKKNRCRISK